jgi:heme/copper-type cytochrome/quinol oxidase subunit 3
VSADAARLDRGRIARPNGWWGMGMLVATEASLFGCFVAAYFYLRFRAPQWPPPGETEPKLAVPLILMGVLLLTSVPMQLASTGAVNGRIWMTRLALSIAMFVQAGYLAFQIHQFIASVDRFAPDEHAYASIYYMLLGAHHAHVFVGILLNAYLLLRLTTGITTYRAVGVQAIALYWNFVNALAVAVTLTLLTPSL